DILINNAGGPPPGNFRDWDRDDWIKALDANMLAGIMLSKAVIDCMTARGFGRIINITSAAVKAPIDMLGLSNGARAGLTGFMAGLARQVAADGITINNLLPGPFETDRLVSNLQAVATRTGRSLDEVRAERMALNPSGRFGNPDEFGAACAFLASAKAGYINGQNIVLDGGAFRGTL
ncbi:MAG: SDR family oxidoreductase, partial [Pseudomonadota bacterium]